MELFFSFFPHKPLRPCVCHVLGQTIVDYKMAASDNTSDSVHLIQSVAQTAIDDINELLFLVEQRGSANPEATQSRRSCIEPERSTDTAIASRSINGLEKGPLHFREERNPPELGIKEPGGVEDRPRHFRIHVLV